MDNVSEMFLIANVDYYSSFKNSSPLILKSFLMILFNGPGPISPLA
jgi:hypothetical protein